MIREIKRKYKQSIIIESLFFLVVSLLLGLKDTACMQSFSLGVISAFLPFVFFVWVNFSIKSEQQINLTRLYLGELVKFLSTVGFLLLFFLIFEINFLLFFIGYIFCLLVNNLLPLGINLFQLKQTRN